MWSNCVSGTLSICCIYCDCQFWVRIFITFGVRVACDCLSSIQRLGASCPAATNSHRMFVNTYTHAYIWSTHPHNIQSCRHVNTHQAAIVPTRIPASHINTLTQRRGKSETEMKNGIELLTKILEYYLWNNYHNSNRETKKWSISVPVLLCAFHMYTYIYERVIQPLTLLNSFPLPTSDFLCTKNTIVHACMSIHICLKEAFNWSKHARYILHVRSTVCMQAGWLHDNHKSK